MPNHVHIIIVPSDEDGLWRTFADAHRRYTGYINACLRVTVAPVLGRYGDFPAFLAQEEDAAAFNMLRQSETTSRPLGADKWIERLEILTARQLKPQKRGPKKENQG